MKKPHWVVLPHQLRERSQSACQTCYEGALGPKRSLQRIFGTVGTTFGKRRRQKHRAKKGDASSLVEIPNHVYCRHDCPIITTTPCNLKRGGAVSTHCGGSGLALQMYKTAHTPTGARRCIITFALKFLRFIEYTSKMKTTTKEMKINALFYRYL